MKIEKQQFGEFSVCQGGPEVEYEEADFEELLQGFVKGVTVPPPKTFEEYTSEKRDYLGKQLKLPETVAVFHGEKLVGMGGLRVKPVESKPNDIYIELKSLIVSEAFRGKDLAKVISAEREKNAVEMAGKEGKGCVLFFMTERENVMESASKRDYVRVPAREWIQETTAGWTEEEVEAEAAEMDNEWKLKVFKNDSHSFKNTHEVDGERVEVGTEVDAVFGEERQPN